MDLSIVIVNWNSRDDLKKSLASIVRDTRDLEYEIVVIDSGSHDGCDRMLRQHFPHVRFIQSAENLGFAKANNRAFRTTTGRCVLFLNPDTEAVGAAVTVLYAGLQSLPDAGVVGCKLLNSDGTIQSSCIRAIPTILNRMLDSNVLRRRWPKSRLWGTAALYEEGLESREVEAVSGACLMMRRDRFIEVGGFSEDYFMYAEDIDLWYKSRQRGFKNYYVPQATVIHHGGNSSQHASSSFSAVMIPEASWRFLRKTRGVGYGFCYRLGMCASALGRLLIVGLASPFWILGRRRAAWKATGDEWCAVLWWTLKRDGIVKRYYPAQPASGGR